ncbi:P27 family phage terminase small subunit [Priestia megaterium]|uniref:P27 family phage terminase small subunit n=1 Tax=Priestia megaterium TaxID=1404 RepID=UPI0032D93A4D
MKDLRTSKEMAKTPLKLDELMGEAFEFNETFSPIEIEPPDHLGEYAKQYYKTIVEELTKLGTSNKLDESQLTNLAFALGLIKECQIEMKGAPLVEGLHGKKENPAMKTWATATQKSIDLMKSLHLSADTRKMLQDQANEDDLSDL